MAKVAGGSLPHHRRHADDVPSLDPFGVNVEPRAVQVIVDNPVHAYTGAALPFNANTQAQGAASCGSDTR